MQSARSGSEFPDPAVVWGGLTLPSVRWCGVNLARRATSVNLPALFARRFHPVYVRKCVGNLRSSIAPVNQRGVARLAMFSPSAAASNALYNNMVPKDGRPLSRGLPTISLRRVRALGSNFHQLVDNRFHSGTGCSGPQAARAA